MKFAIALIVLGSSTVGSLSACPFVDQWDSVVNPHSSLPSGAFEVNLVCFFVFSGTT